MSDINFLIIIYFDDSENFPKEVHKTATPIIIKFTSKMAIINTDTILARPKFRIIQKSQYFKNLQTSPGHFRKSSVLHKCPTQIFGGHSCGIPT